MMRSTSIPGPGDWVSALASAMVANTRRSTPRAAGARSSMVSLRSNGLLIPATASAQRHRPAVHREPD